MADLYAALAPHLEAASARAAAEADAEAAAGSVPAGDKIISLTLMGLPNVVRNL